MEKELNKIDKSLAWYAEQPWLRALVQLPPGGGAIDVLLSHKSTRINQKRVDEFFNAVSTKLASIEEAQLNRTFLESEEFFEIFRRSAEISAHTASQEKRKKVAIFLSCTIKASVIEDCTHQILEDLNALQELHFLIISALPQQSGKAINHKFPPDSLLQMSLVHCHTSC